MKMMKLHACLPTTIRTEEKENNSIKSNLNNNVPPHFVIQTTIKKRKRKSLKETFARKRMAPYAQLKCQCNPEAKEKKTV